MKKSEIKDGQEKKWRRKLGRWRNETIENEDVDKWNIGTNEEEIKMGKKEEEEDLIVWKEVERRKANKRKIWKKNKNAKVKKEVKTGEKVNEIGIKKKMKENKGI